MTKPIKIICDVDCTLYSYREIVQSNQNNIPSLIKASLGITESKSEDSAVKKVWSKYQSEIEQRIRNLIEIKSCETVFYSAFPRETYKAETFEKLNARFISSFPEKKQLVTEKYFPNTDVDLVIGDRFSDCSLAKKWKSSILFLPITNMGQWKVGSSYTDYLQNHIQQKLSKIYEQQI